MPRMVSRIILTILSAPLGLFIGIFSMLILAEGFRIREETAGLISVTTGAWSFVFAQLIIWIGVVRWTRRRRLLTVVALLLGIGLCVGQSIAWAFVDRREWPVFASLINAILALLIVAALVRIWQEKPAERVERIAAAGQGAVKCPLCKYDLSGLSTLTCPECGNTFKLSDVVNAERRVQAHPDLAG